MGPGPSARLHAEGKPPANKAESDSFPSQAKPACLLPPPMLCKSCRLMQGMCRLWSSPEITAQAETMSGPESLRPEALWPELQQVPTYSLCSSAGNHSHAKLRLHCNLPPLPGELLHCIPHMTVQQLGPSWEHAEQERLKALKTSS